MLILSSFFVLMEILLILSLVRDLSVTLARQ